MNRIPISMEEPKNKLLNLREYLPDAIHELVYEFGRLLADRLNPELAPMGFLMVIELLIADLSRGTSGFTGEAIKSNLVQESSEIYQLIRMQIPAIADAVFPSEFAEAVKIIAVKTGIIPSIDS